MGFKHGWASGYEAGEASGLLTIETKAVAQEVGGQKKRLLEEADRFLVNNETEMSQIPWWEAWGKG